MNAKDEEIKYSTISLIKDMWSYLRFYRKRFFVASFLRLIGDVAYLYPSIAIASVVTFFGNYKTGDSLDYFWLLIVFWTIATIVRIIGNHTSKYMVFGISERIALDAQIKTLAKLFKLDIAWHEKENAGNKLKKIQRGANGLDRVLRMWINNYIEICVNFIGITYIMSRTDIVIALIMILFVVTYFLISFLLLRKVFGIVTVVNGKEEEIDGLIFQAVNNIRSVKVSGIAHKIYGILGNKSDEVFIWIKKRIAAFQTRGVALGMWGFIFRLIMTVFISLGIANGKMEVGFLVLFNLYFSRILQSVSELSDVTQDFIINKLGIARMQAMANEPAEENEAEKTELPKDWKEIRIKNLSFAYGQQQVLKNVSFSIKRGERIGIVGLSGAGKSTLFKLFLKESEQYQGEILFDGLPLRDIRKSDYYDHVGVVLQETEVFNFSLKDNITIAANREMPKNVLKQSLKISHVDDFINKLPQGLETFIGEKGVKLSGGEKQRLGIARAIYKEPELLFLDEATSHLDLESEEKIKNSLHLFFQKVTAVVIAHRLTTIKEMDKIVVIDKGRVAESGSFIELYAQKGKFYELWEKQKL